MAATKKHAEIQYKIAAGWPLTVKGYALALPAPWSDLRLCVRADDFGRWMLDHYDTGLRAARLDSARSLGGAIVEAMRWLKSATPYEIETLRGDWHTNPNWIAFASRMAAWKRT